MQDLIIDLIFYRDKAYLSKANPLTMAQVGLSSKLRTKRVVFWTIQVLKHDAVQGKIYCEILSYNVESVDYEKQQEILLKHPELEQVNQISFFDVNSTYQSQTFRSEKRLRIEVNSVWPPTVPQAYPEEEEEEPNRIVEHSFELPFKQALIKNGGILACCEIPGVSEPVDLFIRNDELREEFEAIKTYFIKALRLKTLHIRAVIELLDDEFLNSNAYSPEVDRIDKKMIETVRLDFIKTGKNRKKLPEMDKSLFTMEEYFDSFDSERLSPNVFHQNENDLIEDLLHISQSKHFKNIQFLAANHQFNAMKLRFILKPFSFLFLLAGERYYHLVWETLDTKEATYIWRVPKDQSALRAAIKQVETSIQVIKAQGKIAYLTMQEDHFYRILHDYSNLTDGFVKWKGELESRLT